MLLTGDLAGLGAVFLSFPRLCESISLAGEGTVRRQRDFGCSLFGLYALVLCYVLYHIRWAIAKCTMYAEKGVTCACSQSVSRVKNTNHVIRNGL